MPRAARNIYEQQCQTAQFVATYDRSVCVVLNDIGAVTYFNEVDLIDLVGLGSQAVMRYRLERTLVQLPVVGRWFVPD